MWFTEYETQSNAWRGYIARITLDGVITEYPIPSAYPYPGGLALGSDGALWFTEQVSGKIGQFILPDTTPPLITTLVTPAVLWPPNQKMVPVVVWGKVIDVGSGLLASSLEYAVSDEYHSAEPSGHFVADAGDNYRITVLLRASREGNDLDGRRYYIRIRARDNAGNRAVKWASVIVPHDRR